MDHFDGNISISSFDTTVLSPEDSSSSIPVHIGYRPIFRPYSETRRPVLKVIRRDNKVVQAASLPRISSYNVRSLMPKVNSFAEDMLDRSCQLSFLTEIWTKSENRRHQFKIEELYEMKGLKYISTPRPGVRRGGGVAIVVNTEHYSISKLNVHIPNSLEIVWGLLKPHEVTGKIKKIIVCCFYCPPKSKKKSMLIEHMTLTTQSLLNTFPNAGILISGDRNDLSIDKILSVEKTLKQLVKKGTRGPNILTIICSNLETFYEEPMIVPPIEVDDPQKGVPSDHCGVFMVPRTKTNVPVKRQKSVRTIRPISESAINNLGQVLTQEKWLFMDPILEPTQLTELFEFYTQEIMNIFCPQKQVFTRPNDLPYVTEAMKVLKRKI